MIIIIIIQISKLCSGSLAALGGKDIAVVDSWHASNPSNCSTVAQFYYFCVLWAAANPSHLSTVAQFYYFCVPWVASNPSNLSTVAQFWPL